MVSLPSCLESGLRDWSNWDLRSLDAEWPFYVQWPLTPRKMQWPRTVCTECVRDREGPEGNCENDARIAERMARLDRKKEKLKGHSRGTCLTSIMSLHIIWWIKCNPWLMTGCCDTWSLQNVHQVVTRCRMTKRLCKSSLIALEVSGWQRRMLTMNGCESWFSFSLSMIQVVTMCPPRQVALWLGLLLLMVDVSMLIYV
jgi:hypothetical protein